MNEGARALPNPKWLPVIDPDACDGCGACVEACAPRCLEVEDGMAVLAAPGSCLSEGSCVDPCHTGAIRMDWRSGAGDVASTAELIAALGRVDGKAEVVDGEIVVMSPAGYAHNRAAGNIYVSLRQYERDTRCGVALSDNAGFVVNLPHRKSFSPDAAFHVGPPPGPGFLQGAPVFAVEVRSPDDYGPLAERAMAAKRADYFASGTAVVWDVDVLRDASIAVYRAAAPDRPTLYRLGEVAEAEPGLPSWTFPVDRLLE